MKHTKCPAREKNEARKAKKKGGGERKRNFAFAHARTSQADILHLDQKAAKCETCNRLCGKF